MQHFINSKNSLGVTIVRWQSKRQSTFLPTKNRWLSTTKKQLWYAQEFRTSATQWNRKQRTATGRLLGRLAQLRCLEMDRDEEGGRSRQYQQFPSQFPVASLHGDLCKTLPLRTSIAPTTIKGSPQLSQQQRTLQCSSAQTSTGLLRSVPQTWTAFTTEVTNSPFHYIQNSVPEKRTNVKIKQENFWKKI